MRQLMIQVQLSKILYDTTSLESRVEATVDDLAADFNMKGQGCCSTTVL